MVKMYKLSFFVFFVILFILESGISSCSKDHTIYDTVTITKQDTFVQIKKDTLIITDTTVTSQILCANPWKIQEIRGVTGNIAYYYLRGGTNNTQSFDNEYIVFNSNKTGSYFDNNGGQSSLTWDFASSDNSKIVYTVNFPTVITTITWDNLRFKDGQLRYDEYYSQNGTNSHSQGVRIPKGN